MHSQAHLHYGYEYQIYLSSSRYGVIAAATPRMTAQNALKSQPSAFERPIFLNSLNSILGTCRRKSATGRCIWRNGCLIKPDRENEQLSQKTVNDMQQMFHILSLKAYNNACTLETICVDFTGLSDNHRKAMCTFFPLGTNASHKIALLRR